MAYVLSRGGQKRIELFFEIRSKARTKEGRKKELAQFRASLRALAKRHSGRIRERSK